VNDFGWLRASKSPHWNILPQEERVATVRAVEGMREVVDSLPHASAGSLCAAVAAAGLANAAAALCTAASPARTDWPDALESTATANPNAAAEEEEETEEDPDEI
jgi:hypothetical protein